MMRKRIGMQGMRAIVPALAASLGLALSALAAGEARQLEGVVNVNTASVEELQLLPGVGEARARAIVDLRKQRGGLKSLEDLLGVKGIGEASLDRLRPHVAFDGKTTAHLE
jgi:competence protein ComEA